MASGLVARFARTEQVGHAAAADLGVAGVAAHVQAPVPAALALLVRRRRSEEHTSELQSLMRISYAVFCLQKKKNTHKSTLQHNHECTHIDTDNTHLTAP